MLGKKLLTIVICLHIITNVVFAKKSVFIISNKGDSRVQAYSIESNGVDYQAGAVIDPNYSPVGNAVWPEKNLMFVTFESSGEIIWLSTKTLEKAGYFNTPSGNLAGIAVDKVKGIIYIIERQSQYLYAYSFDEGQNTLVYKGQWYLHHSRESEGGYYISGMGLALDDPKNLLYVSSNGDNRVHIYNTNNFTGSGGSISPDGFIDIVVNSTPRNAKGIAVDPVKRYMFTGDWYGHNYLVRTNIDTNVSDEVEITGQLYSGTANGIGVDVDTGFVFCTTSLNDFRVYDCNLVLKDTEANNISAAAGVAVGGWYKKPYFSISKDNNDSNNACVDPNLHKNLNFDILWDVNGYPDTNMVVIDYLPKELDYNSSSSPPASDYNSVTKTVKWNVSGSSGHIVLKTNVNKWAAPGGTIKNIAAMESDNYLTEASCEVTVCNWGGTIIYVDWDANGFNNGTNWNDAYTDLQDAMNEANVLSPAITAIWVAAGTYKPAKDINVPNWGQKSFELPDNVALIGHFPATGSYRGNPSTRNLADSNESILEGQIGDTSQKVQNVVKMQNISSGLIDGFTIKGASSSGIDFDSVETSVVNCKIINNQSNGIYCKNYSYPYVYNCLLMNNSSYSIYSDTSEPDISYCTFDGNNVTYDGLYLTSGGVSNITNSQFKNHAGSAIYGSNATINISETVLQNNQGSAIYGSLATINVQRTLLENSGGDGIFLQSYSSISLENSVVRKSGYRGIYLSQSLIAEIINNWIHNNGTLMDSSYGSGIYFENQVGIPLVRNNTLYGNFSYGIECSEQGADPNIRNCIISGNGTSDLYRPNGVFNKVNFCLLQQSHSGTGNLTGSPGFMNVTADPNDLHIAENSQCKDAGDPNINYDGQTDIDGEPRVEYGRVDIGGDEFFWPKADYNKNKIVDFNDYATLAKKWKMQDVNISLNDDSDVDIYDLSLFCSVWLWQFAGGGSQWLAMSGDNGEGSSMTEQSLVTEFAGENDSSLMLQDVMSSMNLRPARLRNRTDKFYNILPATSVSPPVSDIGEEPEGFDFGLIEEPIDAQQQSLLLDENQPPQIWLFCDGNMNPSYGDEVTVYVHSEPALLCMVLMAEVDGDANVTSAMSTSDCNNYGWDTGWNTDPVIDPAGGWVEISGVSWNRVPTGNVGYFKFRYYGGEVTVYITDSYDAYDSNLEPVAFSLDPLVFGSDPNQ
ncbi:MAG: right-handed parallel beta-helix repeat-containing protein [Sedimentisphaerales bacterium]